MRQAIDAKHIDEGTAPDRFGKTMLISARGTFEAAVVQVFPANGLAAIRSASGARSDSMHRGLPNTDFNGLKFLGSVR